MDNLVTLPLQHPKRRTAPIPTEEWRNMVVQGHFHWYEHVWRVPCRERFRRYIEDSLRSIDLVALIAFGLTALTAAALLAWLI